MKERGVPCRQWRHMREGLLPGQVHMCITILFDAFLQKYRQIFHCLFEVRLVAHIHKCHLGVCLRARPANSNVGGLRPYTNVFASTLISSHWNTTTSASHFLLSGTSVVRKATAIPLSGVRRRLWRFVDKNRNDSDKRSIISVFLSEEMGSNMRQ